MRAWKLSVALLALLVVGCAATVQRTGNVAPVVVDAAAAKNIVLSVTGTPEMQKSEDWWGMSGEMQRAMRDFSNWGTPQGTKVSVLQNGETPPNENGTHAQLTLIDYRYKTTGSRYTPWGIYTGNAYVKAKVDYFDMTSGANVGSYMIDTSSTFWEGAYSAMTPKQCDAIVRDIVATLKAKP